MLHLCPSCGRRFDETGFCPFDGTALVRAVAEEPTQIVGAPPARPPSDQLPTIAGVARAAAQAAAAKQTQPSQEVPTLLEGRKRTFPLTPGPKPGGGTGEVTANRTRPGGAVGRPLAVRGASEPAGPRMVSASENPQEALELYRTPRDNEYDRLVGQTLDGRYYVEKKIGEGGMGVVFSARHAVIERPLAIKVLKREAMRDTATIRRFVQEAKAASRIGHPNIVDVTDFGTTPDGMTYSVMEFVPGQTLGTALRHSAPFPSLRALRITAQIARALGAAHDKGIVHRDLKPENVFLLDRDGRQDFVKIVDFGIAKVTPQNGQAAEPRLTRAGSVFGTPEYMAPEQAAGRSDTDGRVDIYALGVILYEMICGQVPHRGDSMVRTLAMQMLDPVVPPSQLRPDLTIPHELEVVMLRALAKKREERYQTMAALVEALEAILPPPVGQSVTGSPVYTLAALPPGADPSVVASLPAMPLVSSDPPPPGPHDSATQRDDPPPGPPTGATTERRIKDEPQFTADDRPLSFQHVFTDAPTDSVPPLPPRRRWPALLLFSLIAGGAAGAIAVMVKSRGAVVAGAQRDAGVAPGDAGVDSALALVPVDDRGLPPGGSAAEGRRGLIDAEPDAADLIVLPEPDAGRPVRPLPRVDAGSLVPETPNHRGTILVQVLTKPEGANLYDDGNHYRGPGGAQLEEPYGTRRVIHCKQPGYRPGTVEVSFDGTTTAALCVLQRIKICINNIKNPFDDCELDPGAPATTP